MLSTRNHAHLAIEIEKTNNKTMTCYATQYSEAIKEIMEYIKFKMQLLENQFCFELTDDEGEEVHRVPGSVVMLYNEQNLLDNYRGGNTASHDEIIEMAEEGLIAPFNHKD